MNFFKEAKKLWISLFVILIATFSLMGFVGIDVYREAPPIPNTVVNESGEVVFTKDDILTGQLVWQSIGGQQVGSIWGHGAYQAPDWSADWLHRELVYLLDKWSMEKHNAKYSELNDTDKMILKAKLKSEIRTNSYDKSSDTLTLSNERVEAIREVSKHFTGVFSDDPKFDSLRESYAIHDGAIKEDARLEKMMGFFFWTSWSAATDRPDTGVTYTNNWPHEPLIDNIPTPENILWSILSIILLVGAVGALVWYYAFKGEDIIEPNPPKHDPLSKIKVTPSMKAIWKYVGVVLLLFVVQITLGAITAHYTVEGDAFFGFELSKYLPYAITRTWHIQTGLFWIATSFLGAGLFLAPIIGGEEPKFQALGVNILFSALLLVVFGSLTGEYLAIMQQFDLADSFFWGIQGYEYVDLGRFWQILLFVGLILWLVLMMRALMPALKRNDSNKGIIVIFTGAAVAIGMFYGVGLFIGAKTHMSVMEYWRWWVVHLWVEGFFEVFATSAIAGIFTLFGLIKPKSGTRAVLFSTAIFLVAGIPGTFHHLYFSGTSNLVLSIGATFSALEVVPLLLLGMEAFETMKLSKATPWMQKYKWPLTFFIGVSAWNLVGAGVFGFMINPPIALFYMQGLNTTPVHAHTAVFGVYGLLSLGFLLIIARKLSGERTWKDADLKLAFWGMNLGLILMVGISILPVGVLQTIASVKEGLWYARSAEFMQQPLLENLRWLRIIGDTIFIGGVFFLVKFFIGLLTGSSFVSEQDEIKDENTEEVLA